MTDRGFVLVNVLLLVAALSAVAVGLLQLTTRATQRLDAAQGAAQAPLLLDAGVAFAVQLLSDDVEAGAVDHKGEGWALNGFVADTPFGPVRVTVADLESRMNLNRPLETDGAALEEGLVNLIMASGGTADMALALTSRYASLRSGTAAQPARAAEVTFQSGDFTWLGAATDGAGPPLSDAVFSTLPRSVGINVNTADDRVLASLPGMTPDIAATLLASRDAAPIPDQAALSALLQDTAPAAMPFLTTRSHWFVVITELDLNGLAYRGETILYRIPDTGTVATHLHRVRVDG